MILFLDFDGVLHPMSARSGDAAFCYVYRLENILRKFPNVQLVISSSHRQHSSLSVLAKHFSVEVANSITGVTPIVEIEDAEHIAESRYREIMLYLDGSNEPWFALDDDAYLFPIGCPNLLLCEDGFHVAEEIALRKALSKV